MRVVECPHCGRIIKPHKDKYLTHSVDIFGEECPMSRKPLTAEALEEGEHVRRAQTVMHLACLLRDEDPTFVRRHLDRTNDEELRLLLMTALTAIPVDIDLGTAYQWVRDIGLAS